MCFYILYFACAVLAKWLEKGEVEVKAFRKSATDGIENIKEWWAFSFLEEKPS